MSEDMNEIKKIIAFFLGIDAEQITKETLIDNSVVQGSVKIHMMYGDLAENGYKVADYSNIKTFGELLSILKLSDDTNYESEDVPQVNSLKKEDALIEWDNSNGQCLKNYPPGLGVDILQISKLPHVNDFRESSFYIENFSISEFSYCLLKADPYKSFAGKFAAKEAIVKANNDFKNRSFKEIEILNDEYGKPYFNNFSISISHEDDYAIAIASYTKNTLSENKAEIDNVNQNQLMKLEQVLNNINKNITTDYLKKSYKGLILTSLILNILTITYIAYKAFLP